MADEVFGEEHVGRIQGGHALKAPLTAEAVLEGTPETLDAARGLRGAGQDELRLELVKEAPHRSRLASAGQTLLPAGLLFAGLHEDAVSIGVHGQGHALAHHDLAQHQDVRLGVFLLPEGRCGDLPGGIIDSAHPGHVRTAALHPIVATAVDLEPGPFLGHPVSTVVGPG
ncbi:MAG TPA: hypothetical protein VMW47_09905 [Verrucomicrobiae bacterium]|nr:hypothetical protein [Verrucomicrobiae bacterium]